MSEDTKEKYNTPYTDFGNKSSLKEYWDYNSTLETAERKGEKRGRAEGRAEGEQTKAIEIARRMKSQGMSDSEISSLTGLKLEEVKAL